MVDYALRLCLATRSWVGGKYLEFSGCMAVSRTQDSVRFLFDWLENYQIGKHLSSSAFGALAPIRKQKSGFFERITS